MYSHTCICTPGSIPWLLFLQLWQKCIFHCHILNEVLCITSLFREQNLCLHDYISPTRGDTLLLRFIRWNEFSLHCTFNDLLWNCNNRIYTYVVLNIRRLHARGALARFYIRVYPACLSLSSLSLSRYYGINHVTIVCFVSFDGTFSSCHVAFVVWTI